MTSVGIDECKGGLAVSILSELTEIAHTHNRTWVGQSWGGKRGGWGWGREARIVWVHNKHSIKRKQARFQSIAIFFFFSFSLFRSFRSFVDFLQKARSTFFVEKIHPLLFSELCQIRMCKNGIKSLLQKF